MMKKIISLAMLGSIALSALPVVAAETTNGSGAMMKKTPKEVNLACVLPALTKREAAIASAFSAYSESLKGALVTRANSLQTAWSKTERRDRRAAIEAAWTAYRTSSRAAVRTHRTARRTAWETFRKEARACGSSATTEETVSNEPEI